MFFPTHLIFGLRRYSRCWLVGGPGDDTPFGVALFLSAVDARFGRFTAAFLVGEHCQEPVNIYGGKDQFSALTEPGLDQVTAVFILGHAHIGPGN